jgi:hypothetical protein
MRRMRAGLILMVVQLVLVLSVAGKYLYERKVCPRIWTRAAQYDPNGPLRGRYLALQLSVDACGLPQDAAHYSKRYKILNGGIEPGSWAWDVSMVAKDGHLVAQLNEHARDQENVDRITLREDQPCDRVRGPNAEYYIPDTAKGPFPLKAGEELWVEVTMPPSGPPRPIQLALSSPAGFRPLTDLR